MIKKLFSNEEIERRTARLEEARSVRSKTTQHNDNLVLELIRENPRLSSTEIEKLSQSKHPFARSYLINALKRLEDDKVISFEYSHDGSKIIKKYFVNYGRSLDPVPGVIQIPKQLLTDPSEWHSTGFLYAHKNNIMKISAKENNKLEESSFFNFKIPIEHNDYLLLLKIPQSISDYYDLDVHNYKTLIENNIVRITVIPKPSSIDKKTIDKKTIHSKKILLMEDKDYWRTEFANGLMKAGHHVDPTKTKEDAVEWFDKHNYDYVILDWDMYNKKEGEEVFTSFKKKNPNIKGALITSHNLESHWDRLQRLGFNRIIRKRRFSDDEQDDDSAIKEIVNEQLMSLEMV